MAHVIVDGGIFRATGRLMRVKLADPSGFLWMTGIEDTFISTPHPKTGRTLDEYELTDHYRVWRDDLERVHRDREQRRRGEQASVAEERREILLQEPPRARAPRQEPRELRSEGPGGDECAPHRGGRSDQGRGQVTARAEEQGRHGDREERREAHEPVERHR